MPLRDSYIELTEQGALPLIGLKIVFYGRGMIIVDQRVGAFVLQYSHINKCVFHVAQHPWLEIGVNEEAMKGFACNIIAQGTLLIKVNN